MYMNMGQPKVGYFSLTDKCFKIYMPASRVYPSFHSLVGCCCHFTQQNFPYLLYVCRRKTGL